MINRILFCSPFIALILIGCNNQETNLIDIDQKNNCKDIKLTYDNKNTHIKGKVCDTLKVGVWEEYYFDGSLKWRGYYDNNGVRILDANNIVTNFKYEIKDLKSNKLNTKNTYELRIYNQGNIHPDDLIIMATNSQINYNQDKLNYDFILKPEKIGEIKLYVGIDLDFNRIILDTLILNVDI